MSKDKKDKPHFFFPMAMKIAPKTIGEEIQPMSNEQVAEAMGKLFNKVEEMTGYKVKVENGDSPIQSLFPDSHKEKDNE